ATALVGSLVDLVKLPGTSAVCRGVEPVQPPVTRGNVEVAHQHDWQAGRTEHRCSLRDLPSPDGPGRIRPGVDDVSGADAGGPHAQVCCHAEQAPELAVVLTLRPVERLVHRVDLGAGQDGVAEVRAVVAPV